MTPRLCSIEGCETTAIARGWCGMHYRRWRLNGDPNIVLPTYNNRVESDASRFQRIAVATSGRRVTYAALTGKTTS